MTSIGDRLLRLGRPGVGIGASVAPDDIPKSFSITHKDWKEGYVSADADADIPEDASPNTQDIESRFADSLIRAPGIASLEDVNPRSLRWMFEHASLNYSTELVAIDPPYVGVRNAGGFVWTNKGIGATGAFGWEAVNVAGFLLFSNGIDQAYVREWGTGILTDVSAQVIAVTFGNSFGRCFAGAFVDNIAGLTGLGIKWNAANDDPTDWAGIGSGNVLLISNQQEADILIALRPIGFDVLAAVCRKNLWLGYPTGDPNEPAEFRVRFPGVGGVSARTTVACPLGVITLDDRGVVLFNINEATIISGPINNKLLPIDYTLLDQYFAIYNHVLQRFQLYTPSGTWIWVLPTDAVGDLASPTGSHPGRWYFRTYYPAGDASAAMFTVQSGNLFWNTVQGTWSVQTLNWADMVIGDTLSPSLVTHGDSGILGYENDGTADYFGTPQDPFWTTKQDAERSTDLITSESFEIEFLTNDTVSQITIERIDENGDVIGGSAVTLPNSMGVRMKRMFWLIVTGQGTSFKLSISNSTPEIFSVKHTMSQAAPTLQAVG